nr:MAG TPA: hypothetical protein [Caudoviricetes sp.]
MNDIIEHAKAQGLCNEWYEQMKAKPTLKNLCEMYFKGDDWAKEHDFPKLKDLRKYRDEIMQYGLYTDFSGRLENINRLAVFGDSNVELEYNNFEVAQIIIRHNSRAKIIARDYAILTVDVLDNAQVEVEELDNAKIRIYRK